MRRRWARAATPPTQHEEDDDIAPENCYLTQHEEDDDIAPENCCLTHDDDNTERNKAIHVAYIHCRMSTRARGKVTRLQ